MSAERLSSPEKSSWSGTTLYHLYLPSFKDTNNDGLGDLGGVLEKLPYLQELGVDTILMSPLYPSLEIESGYAVSNYCDIDKRFGTMQDVEQLIYKLHSSGMRVIFDLVMNHSSNEHPWFLDSASSQDSDKSDWYIWENPKDDGTPPSNLIANFGGNAWEYVPEREQYYYHTFLKEQPDLNYKNPEVVQAMCDVMRFWFAKGIDGMRLDSLPFIFKGSLLEDEEENLEYQEGINHPFKKQIHKNIWYQPEMLSVLKEFNSIATAEYQDKFLISEAYPPSEVDKTWIERIYESSDEDNHAILNSGTIGVLWRAKEFSQFVTDYYKQLHSHIPLWILDSHDEYQRLVNRIGEAQARVATMWLLTMPSSMSVVYYGDEIGMKSWPVPPDTKTNVFHYVDSNSTRTKESVRLPLSWNEEEFAGFSTTKPWLPIANDYKDNNVDNQINNPDSFFSLCRELIKHRKQSDAIQRGNYRQIEADNEEVYAYECMSDEEREIIALNFSPKAQNLDLKIANLQKIISTRIKGREDIDGTSLTLLPHEGIIFRAGLI